MAVKESIEKAKRINPALRRERNSKEIIWILRPLQDPQGRMDFERKNYRRLKTGSERAPRERN